MANLKTTTIITTMSISPATTTAEMITSVESIQNNQHLIIIIIIIIITTIIIMEFLVRIWVHYTINVAALNRNNRPAAKIHKNGYIVGRITKVCTAASKATGLERRRLILDLIIIIIILSFLGRHSTGDQQRLTKAS